MKSQLHLFFSRASLKQFAFPIVAVENPYSSRKFYRRNKPKFLYSGSYLLVMQSEPHPAFANGKRSPPRVRRG
ncbi:hypothetical protein [Nostoc piscinale]|uniref:hypothetical protein n=1 Tax=Nostoc piscinale TaxID=224012 RepID=UPI0007852260|nr:hypothetical protein [Nostoc piscinale]